MISSRPNAVVLLSGGLDSTVTAAIAQHDGYRIHCMTVSYGQRHHVEVERARAVAERLEAAGHVVVTVDLRAIGGSAITADVEVPKDRTQDERAGNIPVTYVPARNTIFLSLALAYAETVSASAIYFGANVLDYSGYPDCRPDFIRAFETVARLGTKTGVEGQGVEVRAPLLMLSKAAIVRRGQELNVPFELTHSCYDPGAEGVACGRCDSCRIRREGFRLAGVVDPVPYAIL
ncbi:MAG: 7-cyano-7-deazaguanine synthase QueC [Nitrospira sp. CR1.1]|jgi:7-cyano-7-deazaguanine synthase|nr:7-cyano-7-deazaguanine synthase QueC [Nitrospira sp. CR1.1]